MNQLPREKILSIIQAAFWDKTIDSEKIYEAIVHHKALSHLDLTAVYARLLQSWDWYLLRKIFSDRELLGILNDTVLTRIYPEDLREKYRYARKLLSSTAIPASG